MKGEILVKNLPFKVIQKEQKKAKRLVKRKIIVKIYLLFKLIEKEKRKGKRLVKE